MFSINYSFALSGSCPPVCVTVWVCACVCARIGLNKPRDVGLVTQLSAIRSCLILPLLLHTFQRPTAMSFPRCCYILGGGLVDYCSLVTAEDLNFLKTTDMCFAGKFFKEVANKKRANIRRA